MGIARLLIFVINYVCTANRGCENDITFTWKYLLVLTSGAKDLLHYSKDFPVVIQSRDYSLPNLESLASLILGPIPGILPF